MTWVKAIKAILSNGKTIAGAILTLAASIGAMLTPEDLALLQTLLSGSNTAGQAIMAIGLLHKLYKASQAKSA